jgi:uncharacterized protein
LRRVVERFVRAFAPERIVMFGSYAKGTSHSKSDVDLLVVADFAEDGDAHLRRARQLAADCFPLVDVVFATPADVDGAASAGSPFLLSILKTGVTLFERQSPPARARAVDE